MVKISMFDRRYFTRHGLHMNTKGKKLLCSCIYNHIKAKLDCFLAKNTVMKKSI